MLLTASSRRMTQQKNFGMIQVQVHNIKCFYLAICIAILGAGEGYGASNCTKPTNQCTRVIGCVLGAPNELFFGEVHGVQSGRFAAKTNFDVTCTGTFKRTLFGTAKVKAVCDDGRTARATFAYYHQQTGT